MHPKIYLITFSILLGGLCASTTSFAGNIAFRTRTFQFDGGERSEYYAPIGDRELVYRPLFDWRFWQTDSGGAFENRDDPTAGQLKFYLEPAPFKTTPGEVEEAALVAWFRRFVPSSAENVEFVSLKADESRFHSSTLSSCQFNYEDQGLPRSLMIWAHPMDDQNWLCFTYGNEQGSRFSSNLGKLQRTFMRLDLEKP